MNKINYLFDIYSAINMGYWFGNQTLRFGGGSALSYGPYFDETSFYNEEKEHYDYDINQIYLFSVFSYFNFIFHL